MKQITLLISTLLLSTIVWAQESLSLPGQRVLAYETHKIEKGGPVFVFLPGIYRGYSLEESFIQMLKKQNLPFVLMHFAEHPDSVALTGAIAPQFSNVNAAELANEVAAVVKTLKIDFPVPVTLSYSAVDCAFR